MTRPRPCFNCGEETHYEDETRKWSTSLCDDHYFCHANCVKEYGARLERERNLATVRNYKAKLRQYRNDHAGHSFCEMLFREAENEINAVAAGAEMPTKRAYPPFDNDGSIPSDGITLGDERLDKAVKEAIAEYPKTLGALGSLGGNEVQWYPRHKCTDKNCKGKCVQIRKLLSPKRRKVRK
jgi:hypothetical protein